MKPALRRATVTAIALVALVAPANVRGEVTRIEITRREDVLAGRAFGMVGPYEKLVGKVFFAIDPNNPHNKIIVDLDKAPRNSQGKVEFSADLYVLKPKDQTRGNGVLFFDVVNRGNKNLLGAFSLAATRTADPTAEADFGDGYLMREGYTLVAVGWQFDVAKGRGLVGFDGPVATENGKSIEGWIRPWFIADKAADAYEYVGVGYNTRAYLPLDPTSPEYRLTERVGFIDAPRLIPRDEWQFARVDNGKLVPNPSWVWLKGGFKAGRTYELAFETKDPPVSGLGFASIRDLASALKYRQDMVVSGQYVYTYGQSQTGRFQRHMVYEGFTIDEQGRRAIDGMFIQTGGSSLGSYNERFAQPNEIGSFTQTKFPILYQTTTDPVTGRKDGLGARVPPGLEPKLMLVDTSSEYWDRGRVAALRHTSIDGQEDVTNPPNVRTYLIAQTQHGPGTFPPRDNGGQLQTNVNDYRWAQRGLLAALDQWVRKDVAPPPDRHPRLSEGTLVLQQKIKFPDVPGIQWPYAVPGGYRADVPGPSAMLPFLVPQVDADGNERSGILLPEQAVPLATNTGWGFRGEGMGAPSTLIAMAGSYLPFPRTRAEREKNHDPRLSIEERYPSRAIYLRRVEEAATHLAQDRYLLQEDIPGIVQRAGQQWDWIMSAGQSSRAAK